MRRCFLTCFPTPSCPWKTVFFLFLFFPLTTTWLLWLICLCISIQWQASHSVSSVFMSLPLKRTGRRYSYHLQHHKKVEWSHSFNELLLFSMRTPLGFYESSINLNMVKIRPKIIGLCTSAEPKHFIAAADNSLALLFNYMWTYVFHTVIASNSQFPRDIQLSVLYLTNEHCQEQLWRCHLLHKGKNSCQSWPMYGNIFILKELLCWLCCSGGWIIPVYSLHISLLNLYSILGIIRMKGTIKCKVLLKSRYEKKWRKDR